jgi:hypothetical protein
MPERRGGAREGAGRGKGEATKMVEEIRARAVYHAVEEEELAELNKSTNKVKIVKKLRYVAVLDMLWKEAVQNKNVTASKEYLDRTMGKATQPIEHSGEIKSTEQGIPDNPAVRAAQTAYHEALKSEAKKKNG